MFKWYISLKQRLDDWFHASFPQIFSTSLFWITLFCFLIYIFTQMVVLITTCSSIHILVNSWWPSESIWWHKSGSTLAQVMVCCLKAPSHCLNLCWLVRNVVTHNMMTSSNGNIFPITDHLCREFTGPRWIPCTEASDAELWCFLWSASE